MKIKPDAYALFATGSPSDIIKCDSCSFRAVRAQWAETGGKCPACKVEVVVENGHAKKKGGN